jgi:hypothetical protein
MHRLRRKEPMEPTWYTFPDFLIEQFPELRSEIEEDYFFWLDGQSNPFPHIFLTEVFGPILFGQHRLSGAPERARAGAILDQLLVSSDEDLAAAALTAIIEVLRDNTAVREATWPFLGPVAREWLSRLVSAAAIPDLK